jgi:hypothetical protein
MTDYRTMERGGSMKKYVRDRAMTTQRRGLDTKAEDKLKKQLENANPEDFLPDEELKEGELSDVFLGLGEKVGIYCGGGQVDKFPLIVYYIWHNRNNSEIIERMLSLYGFSLEEHSPENPNGIYLKKPDSENFISSESRQPYASGRYLQLFVLLRSAGVPVSGNFFQFFGLTIGDKNVCPNLSVFAKLKIKEIAEMRKNRITDLSKKPKQKR